MGARPMERLIQEKIKLPLSKEILSSRSTKGTRTLVIDIKDEKIVITSPEKELA
jgi:ATP-dependent Clp protease ATP-binding subunit ClpA